MSQHDAAFVAFDAAHPEVWREFVRITGQLIDRGYRRYSADGVMHIVRFTTRAGDNDNGREFKINNNHVSRYARRWREQHPKHADFFKTRELRAA